MREPVEQFGMRGRGAHEAEVVRGGDEALAEVLLPDAVHDHAGGERVIGARDPLCKAEATIGKRRLRFGENHRHRRLDEIAKSSRRAAHEHMRLGRFPGGLTPSVNLRAIDGHGQLGAAFARAFEWIEDGDEAVVVARGQRLELVVVTTGAADGEAEKGLPGGADDVVELIVAIRGGISGFIIPMTEAKKAGGDVRFERAVRQFVTCELLDDEAVEGFVLVERLNDVIAVAPDEGLLGIALVAVGIGVAHHIQPVACPAFAVCGASEEVVDDCIERWVLLLFGDRRWQASEIEVNAAKQSWRRRLW